MKTILLTGATGFLGGELLMLLSKDVRVKKIYCLIRAENFEKATERLGKVFAFHDDFFDHDKIVAVSGDLSEASITDQLNGLCDVDTIIHSAADTSFAPGHKDNIEKVNVIGASNIAAWAANLLRLETFVYVGTSWICGCDRPGRIVYEDESPDITYTQLLDYPRSKTRGEIAVRRTIPEDKLLIVRPSIIMGDSRSWEPRSPVISWALAAFDALRLIPVKPESKIDIIPVDYAVKGITGLVFSEKRKYGTYHISSGDKSATTLKQLLEAVDCGEDEKPPACFVDYNEMAKQMRIFAESYNRENLDGLANYSAYLDYWVKTFNGKGCLKQLLWGTNFYCRFINLNLVFNNSRMLEDTGLDFPEPAHEYMHRNREHLKKVDVISGAEDP